MTIDELERLRPSLFGHCYRMLGSPTEADDAVQETLVKAWSARGSFEGRSERSTWLHRIATHVCIDQLRARGRRHLPMQEHPAGTPTDDLVARSSEHWIEPVPDGAALPVDVDPERRAVLRQSLRLAFVAAVQRLPARQRAVLLLKDVLGFSADEIAETLGTTRPAVNSALQRARASLAATQLGLADPEMTDAQRSLVEEYVDAFHDYDIDRLVGLLTDDAQMSMPPYTLWLEGPRTIGAWFLGKGAACRGSRLVPTAACGSVAFAQYKPIEAELRAWSLVVLELSDDRITTMTHFLDVETLFPRFGLELALPVDSGAHR